MTFAEMPEQTCHNSSIGTIAQKGSLSDESWSGFLDFVAHLFHGPAVW
jgi:hypothetical protein